MLGRLLFKSRQEESVESSIQVMTYCVISSNEPWTHYHWYQISSTALRCITDGEAMDYEVIYRVCTTICFPLAIPVWRGGQSSCLVGSLLPSPFCQEWVALLCHCNATSAIVRDWSGAAYERIEIAVMKVRRRRSVSFPSALTIM